MGILADFEDSIGKVIEGTFGGIFRSHVQPAEIARVCAKEMDRSKKLGIGKVYVANFYTVILSPRDGDALGGLKVTLVSELETYLLAHARESNYQLPTHPVVNFVTDPELKLGRFDIVGETMSQAEIDKELGLDSQPSVEPSIGVRVDAPGDVPNEPRALLAQAAEGVAPAVHTPVTSPPFANDKQPPPAAIVSPLLGAISLEDQDVYTIGRKSCCDITVDDSAVSRLHATLTHDGRVWILTDNDATNTTQVNERPITTHRLRTGDTITIGTTQLTYRIEKDAPKRSSEIHLPDSHIDVSSDLYPIELPPAEKLPRRADRKSVSDRTSL
jgi:hypothetical protein